MGPDDGERARDAAAAPRLPAIDLRKLLGIGVRKRNRPEADQAACQEILVTKVLFWRPDAESRSLSAPSAARRLQRRAESFTTGTTVRTVRSANVVHTLGRRAVDRTKAADGSRKYGADRACSTSARTRPTSCRARSSSWSSFITSRRCRMAVTTIAAGRRIP